MDFQVEVRAWINVGDCENKKEALTRVALCGRGALEKIVSAKPMKMIDVKADKAITLSEKWRSK